MTVLSHAHLFGLALGPTAALRRRVALASASRSSSVTRDAKPAASRGKSALSFDHLRGLARPASGLSPAAQEAADMSPSDITAFWDTAFAASSGAKSKADREIDRGWAAAFAKVRKP